MGILEISMLGIGLAMDAFAVSISKGLLLKHWDFAKAIYCGFLFGLFQALMPFIGFLSGKIFGKLITDICGIASFIILSLIGGNMIRESLKNDEEKDDGFGIAQMIILAIATSIDAFAVGITLSFYEVKIGLAILVIGIITFVLSIIGVLLGNSFKIKLKTYAEILGGMILIAIGIKSLIQNII